MKIYYCTGIERKGLKVGGELAFVDTSPDLEPKTNAVSSAYLLTNCPGGKASLDTLLNVQQGHQRRYLPIRSLNQSSIFPLMLSGSTRSCMGKED